MASLSGDGVCQQCSQEVWESGFLPWAHGLSIARQVWELGPLARSLLWVSFKYTSQKPQRRPLETCTFLLTVFPPWLLRREFVLLGPSSCQKQERSLLFVRFHMSVKVDGKVW